MISRFNPVPEDTWTVADDVDPHIRDEILEAVDPSCFVTDLREQVRQAFCRQNRQRCVAFYDECLDKDASYRRYCILLVTEDPKLFNQLFNGRCGYRAMYYNDPDIGSKYNSMLVRSIVETIRNHKRAQASPLVKSLNAASLEAGSVKIWPFYELRFAPGSLSVERWKGKMGARIFCPICPTIILKGGFVTITGGEKDLKPNRAKQIHDEGFS